MRLTLVLLVIATMLGSCQGLDAVIKLACQGQPKSQQCPNNR